MGVDLADVPIDLLPESGYLGLVEGDLVPELVQLVGVLQLLPVGAVLAGQAADLLLVGGYLGQVDANLLFESANLGQLQSDLLPER